MKNPNGKDCVRCHLDHNGENFSLIHWEPSQKQFDHRLTGYPLQGKHGGVACEKCHTPAHMIPEIRALLKRQNPAASFLGASTQCIACHEDYHKGQLGKKCEDCHNVNDWKDAKNFDHSKTRYPLTGLHIQVACEKCHKPDKPGGPVRFRDMKFANCSDCHLDPHHGAFKEKRCEDCHTTAGWKKTLPAFQFDHSIYVQIGARASRQRAVEFYVHRDSAVLHSRINAHHRPVDHAVVRINRRRLANLDIFCLRLRNL